MTDSIDNYRPRTLSSEWLRCRVGGWPPPTATATASISVPQPLPTTDYDRTGDSGQLNWRCFARYRIWKELLKSAAVFPGTTVGDGRRRHLREDSVVAVSAVTIAKRTGKITAFRRDVLLIAGLPVGANKESQRCSLKILTR
jgi:hypothetical protein